jgi:UDP-N-acetylmuramoyl-tripeptide--D-alanyl-D-alanine ligase
MLTLREVATLARGTLVAAGGGPVSEEVAARVIDAVSTDSRALSADALFVALAGEHFDAHAFIDDIAAVAVVASRPSLGLPTIVVADTRRALGDLAAGWRRRFAIPLVTVTGSNGKTTTKEMIASIFAAAYGAEGRLATRGNLNNDIGVPLTLLGLRSQHRAAVVEVGMNHPLETARLAEIAGPSIALVVNAQREHQEFMQSVAAVADEHALSIAALPRDGVAVFPDDDAYAEVWRRAADGRRVVDFVCATDDAPIGTATVVGRARSEREDMVLRLTIDAQSLDVRLAVPGLHNARNATAAAAVALAAGIPLAEIRQGLEDFVPLGGRSQRLVLDDGTTLIDDSYNANPDSMRAAIDLLASHAGSRPMSRLLVMGDMGEVGDAGPRFHEEIGLHARARGIETLYALGDASRGAVDAFGSGARHFPAVEPLIAEVATWVRDSRGPRAIVVKGSRFMRMERVVAAVAGRVREAH